MIEGLIEIIERLRAPDGCPWDREQTPTSVKKYLIEEVYELVDAVDEGIDEEVEEELGDLLFMILFIGYMYEEKRRGFLKGAIRRARDKMIRRHPHIFGDAKVENSQDVKANWQTIKEKEAKKKGKSPSVLGEIPRSLPALQRAYRLGERASRVGFDWEGPEGVQKKLDEEMDELKEAMGEGDGKAIKRELGDVLFTMANLARHLGINPEDTLYHATKRFEERFKRMEEALRKRGEDIFKTSLEVMDELWDEVKEGEQ